MKKVKVGVTPKKDLPVNTVDQQSSSKQKYTKLEKLARREQAQSIRVASYGGGFGNNGGGSISNADSAFYSPQLSTDFLELPQSEREKRELFRFWYVSHPIVGAAIDFHCFPPGAPVSMKDGSVKPIECMNIGDEILNGLGEPTKVVQTFRHDINGPTTRLKVRGVQGTIDCTENHPFLVYRADQINCKFPLSGIGACKSGSKSICKQKNCSGLDFGKPKFIFAKDLRVGDYICSPSMLSSNSIFNKGKLRLLGYFAAEGSVSRTKYDHLDRVVFSLNIDEYDTIAEEIVTQVSQEFGLNAIKKKLPDSNSCQVRVYNKKFAEFCVENCGESSLGKKLSLNVVNSSREDVLNFLGAYWNGDGSLTKNGYVATTVSRQLAHQIHALALKVGYSPTLHSSKPKPSNTGFKSNGTIYRVIIPYRFHTEFSQYANTVQNGYEASSTRNYNIQIGSNTLRRIENTETIHYEGPVYNIEVEGEGDRKSYIAYSLSTHNTDVPMSKIRLSLPKGKDLARNKQILHFYEQMCKRIRLFQVLYDATHEYWLHGNVFIFCEDHDLTQDITEEMISDIAEEEVGEVDYAGRTKTRIERKKKPKLDTERVKAIREHVVKNYRGWERLQILPPEQVKLEVFQYTNRAKMELIPSEKDRIVVMKAQEQHDDESARIAEDIPEQIRENLLSGQPIPLNTSPFDDFLCSSFCHHLTHKKSSYDDRGISILERCHVPGTEVTAKRDGLIQQIPIEELNPETDLVLGGSGNWRKFQVGSRPYNGQLHEITINKLFDPVISTPDHKMTVLRGDTKQEILACEVTKNDHVKIPQIKLNEIINTIDLFEFFKKEKWVYEHRDNKDVRPVGITPIVNNGKLTLHHSWVDENPQRGQRAEILNKVIDWIGELKTNTIMLADEIKTMFGGIGDSIYKALIKDLVSIGYTTPFVMAPQATYGSKGRLFIPAKLDSKNLYEKTSSQECPIEIKLTRELGFIIGYFLGDGWVDGRNSPSRHGQLGICYDRNTSNSMKSLELIQEYAKNIGLDFRIEEQKLNWFRVENDWFNRWVGRNFGHNKIDKHLPEWIFDSPEEFRVGILSGLFDSDGWVSISKDESKHIDASICMTTKILIDQLTLLAFSMGMTPSRRFKGVRKVKQANGAISDAKPQYTVVFGCSEDLIRLKIGGSIKLNDTEIIERINSGRKHKILDGNIYYKVYTSNIKQTLTNIDQTLCSKVYSLNVCDDHTFFSGFYETHNCLRTLLYQDKLRQAQTSIASRAMTPKRVIWADKMSEPDTEGLRDQIDQALIDPDFSIITNFEIHWDEVGSRDRLLDLSTEYDITNKLLFIGLRITESMLTGESTYSGERIHLDVMNTMYLLYRETLAEFVEESLFAPVAEKKGFWEEDEFGNKILLYPKLQFTRLALRDNTELQDFMFNLYNKGSLPISHILELLNIDSDDTLAQLKKDMFTPNDANFNEFVRAVLTKAGEDALDVTDVMEKLTKAAGLKYEKKKGDRYGKDDES